MSKKSYRSIFMVPVFGKVLGVVMIPFLPAAVIFFNLLEERFFWDDIVSNFKDLLCLLKRK